MIDLATMEGVPRAMTGTAPELDAGGLPDDPVALFASWLTEAVGAGVPEPLAATLATVDADGLPDARTLVLRRVTEAGWEFSSDAGARKAAQLDACPGAALDVYWPSQARAVRVRGPVAEVPGSELPEGLPPGTRQWRIAPVRVEFWQGASDDERVRVVFERDDGAGPWRRERTS